MPRVGECRREPDGGVAGASSALPAGMLSSPPERAASLGTGGPASEELVGAGGETTSMALRGLAGSDSVASVAIDSSMTGLDARGGSSVVMRARAPTGSTSAVAPLHTHPSFGATSMSTGLPERRCWASSTGSSSP